MLKIHAKNLGTAAILSLQGQIITGQTSVLRDAVYSLPETRSVTLDLSRVTIVDAHGLGVLLELREHTLKNGSRLNLMNVSSPMRRVFEITRLDTVFPIISSVEFFPAVADARRESLHALKPCA